MKTIGYLTSGETPEEEAGWQFLASRKRFNRKRLFLEGDLRPQSLRDIAVLWMHSTSVRIPGSLAQPATLETVRGFVDNGGSLLLSLTAAQYVTDLGIEPTRPNLIVHEPWNRECWADDYPDIRGFAGRGGHPIFDGFDNGVYTWSPRRNSLFGAALYQAPGEPSAGRVVAVERQYIKINEEWRIITEYSVGRGRILAVGAFLAWAEPERRFQIHRDTFADNCLRYLAGQPSARRTVRYWSFAQPTVKEQPQASRRIRYSQREWSSRTSSLAIERQASARNVFDVGGRRILIMGKEHAGVDEIWCHPVRILRDVRIGFLIGGDAIRWADSFSPEIVARPESLTRRFTIGNTTIEETTVAHLRRPCGTLHFTVRSRHAVSILLTARSDLRLMWPLSHHATGSLKYSWDAGLQAATISGEGSTRAILGSSVSPTQVLLGQFESMEFRDGHLTGVPTTEMQVAIGMIVPLRHSRAGTTVCFAGSGTSVAEADSAYAALARNSHEALNDQVRHWNRFLKNSTSLVSPDEEFNKGYRWALVGTDRFYVETPGVGRSFMAGYATTARGWDGAQRISGRPGYAWYFGRDSVWTALAVLDYGDHAKVRDTLAFLGDHQEVTGKILHELTTSGHCHYDAADATPLYAILMGRYVRATGDKTFATREFSRLENAIAFCASTDTDGDHLIENTNVGHGWVEGGQLFPVHVELYLASCWREALKEAAYVARLLGKRTLSHRWEEESGTVLRIIQERFWNPATSFYNFGMYEDGSFNSEKTVLPAVSSYFGHTHPGNMSHALSEFATDTFSTDWGVRIVGKDNHMYHPEGYHYGSIWPLFTGWLSLAEFRNGRPLQGFRRIMSTLPLYRRFSAGFIPEVLHGEELQSTGVCDHQAWSETMVLQPVLEGLLGLDADAVANCVTLRPYLVPGWDTLRVKNIRIGNRRLEFSYKRLRGKTEFLFRCGGRSPIAVKFQPRLPLGTDVLEFRVGRTRVRRALRVDTYETVPVFAFRLSRSMRIVIHHRGGIEVRPPLVTPAMYGISTGMRIIDESWDDGRYTLVVEGPAGSTGEIEILSGDREAAGGTRNRGVQRIGISFPSSPSGTGYTRSLFTLQADGE